MPDLAFRMTNAGGFPANMPPGNALGSVDAALAAVNRIEARRTAPFGVVDHPLENAEVTAGEWSFGWALDDSGIARVTVSAEGVPRIDCAVHSPYPGVDAVYPGYSEAKMPGFGCPVPKLPAGPRVLLYELIANDGGTTTLRRPVRVRR